MRASVLAALLLAVLPACMRKEPRPAETEPKTAAPAHDSTGAILFLSADMRGYLGPCGCSENMRGGIGRAAQQILDARAGSLPVLYVDGGDSLFGESTFPPGQVPQEERKARALAEAMKLMGLSVRAVGELDDARGAAFRQSLHLPELPAGQVKLLDAGARKVGVVSATSGEQLVALSTRARGEGADFVVGLLHTTVEVAQAAAELPGLAANVVVATHTASEFSGEENKRVRAAVPVVALQSKGRSLLRIDLTYSPTRGPFSPLRAQDDTDREVSALEQRMALLDKDINLPGVDPRLKALKQGKRDELAQRKQALLTAPPIPTNEGNGFTLRFLPLDPSLPTAPAAQALVTSYDSDVGKMNLAWAKEHGEECPAPQQGQAAFVGTQTCRECHAEAYAVWEKTLHSHAWGTLEQAGKQYHLNCVGCHVTGWQRPGGVCRLDKVMGRENVGCESCHGPGSLHVENPGPTTIVATPGREACLTCHNPENSPHFDFATYLPRILGPGHGKPLDVGQPAKRPSTP
ncbi:cytochrome C [Corallococcus sp. M34]|uniref:multiheme c-type cytochrome n=1 Tax=Citreicoccus inhibens TaxID=2849499 RepID=UPI001C249F0C|nr:multiheme c-type cytochrome [Citreicoccus inhibens]MBU8899298.1 cytochrome C [Citreicoccus inhibens]